MFNIGRQVIRTLIAALLFGPRLYGFEVAARETGPLQSGDIELQFDVSPDVRQLLVFYGEDEAWLVRMAVRRGDHFAVTLFDYTGQKLSLRYYAEDENGRGEYLTGPTLPVNGSKASARTTGAGCDAGFNIIPSPDPEGDAETEIILRDLARLELRSVLLNLYAPHLQLMVDNGRLERIFALADELGLKIWICVRDTEALGRDYRECARFTPEEMERHAFEFVQPRHYSIPDNGVIRDDTGGLSDQWSLPSNSARDISSIKAWIYDWASSDPLPSATEVPAENIAWEIDFPDPHRKFAPRIKYEIRGLKKDASKAVTVHIAFRTLRVWTIPPVWDDQYYEEIYKKRVAAPLVKCVKGHPSFAGVAAINEPTFTWEGGDLFHPSIEARWQAFLKERYGTAESAAKALGVQAKTFSEIPYLPRIVYSGADHSSWSGRIGEAGFTSEYELCKNAFKESLMKLVFARTIGAFRELMPEKEFFVKFQHAGPSTYALQTQQCDEALRMKEIGAMAYDFYPLGYWPEGKQATPAEAAVHYLAAAGYGGMLGQAYGKPVWAAETNFGRARTHEGNTAASTRLMLDLLFANGFSRVFLWAIPPSGWSNDDPYWAGSATFAERTTRALEEQVEFVQRNRDRKIALPAYDLVVLTPKSDAVLFGANKDHYVTNEVKDLLMELLRRGFTVGDGPLTPETVQTGSALVIFGGWDLTDEEVDLIREAKKPVLLLGLPHPHRPVDGRYLGVRRGLDDETTRKRAPEFAGAPRTPSADWCPLEPPPEAILLEAAGVLGGTTAATLFRVGDRWTCTTRQKPREAAELIDWWFRAGRK